MIHHTLELAALGPVIPVIVLQHVEHAVPMARALVEGGVRVLEVTLRTPVALACSSAVSATESPPSSIDPTTVNAFVPPFAPCRASRSCFSSVPTINWRAPFPIP